jgi:MATE family multidrug resistance protein
MRWTHIRSELPPLVRLALPLIAGELGWVSMSLVDTVMLGRGPNAALAMAAAALAQVLFNTLCFGVGGILLGLDTLISQALGARQQEEANAWLLHGLVMAVALSALLMAAFAFGPLLLVHLPVDRAILAQAVPAVTGLNYGTLPLLLYFTLRRYLQAANHGRPIAFALISANLINAAGDWLLIFGHHWRGLTIPAYGVLGSSWSTSFARLYLMAVLLIAVWWLNRRHSYGLGLVFRGAVSSPRAVAARVKLQHMRRLLQLGAPAGASIFVEIGIFALVTTLIATFGKLPLAGHEVARQHHLHGALRHLVGDLRPRGPRHRPHAHRPRHTCRRRRRRLQRHRLRRRCDAGVGSIFSCDPRTDRAPLHARRRSHRRRCPAAADLRRLPVL